jgi:UDP-GlcNAc3NAcA epimerase
MKIVTIIGARPQFIKAATVSRAIVKHNTTTKHDVSLIREIIVHTGQHFDRNMSDIFFEEMEIRKPEYFLDINGLTHGAMTGQMLEKIEEVLFEEKPDVVIVYGDTNSTLAGALASAKLHIPVAHVEAGLRSFNHSMPEEINRVLTDHISEILFCPTRQAVENLKAEGITERSKLVSEYTILQKPCPSNQIPKTSPHLSRFTSQMHLVGDVMYDSVLYNTRIAEKRSRILGKLKLKTKSYALATVHRAENTDNHERLKSILYALEKVSQDVLPILMPLHPRTRKKIESLELSLNSLKLIDPVAYLDMLLLEKEAKVILTDSGGVQKEAYWFRVPCVTLRDETEWGETVEAGWNVLAGCDPTRIVHAVREAQTGKDLQDAYGNGRAAERIVEVCSQ